MLERIGKTRMTVGESRVSPGAERGRFGTVEVIAAHRDRDGTAIGTAAISVAFRNRRLVDISPVLIGKPAAAAPGICQRLLPVCGWAQGIACLSAVEVASGTTPDPVTARARALLVLAEAVVSAIRHAAIDWPEILGEQPELRCLHYAQKALDVLIARLWQNDHPLDPLARAQPLSRVEAPIAALLEAIETAVLPKAPTMPEALADWARTSPAGLPRMARRAAQLDLTEIPHSPPLPALEVLAASLAAEPGFSARPHHNGQPCDPALRAVIPLGAKAFGTVGERYLHQILTIRDLSEALKTLAVPAVHCLRTAPHIGVAQVPTLRGPLMHRVVLQGDGDDRYIAGFSSVAPTEWMLHPDGALAQVLAMALSRGYAEDLALIVAGFDPCAPVHLVTRSNAF